MKHKYSLFYKEIDTTHLKKGCFIFFLFLLIIDRVINLIHFGWVYTDIDQLVMWNATVDYAQGIFHEPFFYGQPYNYMLEALLAAPLYNLGVPLHICLPFVTSSLILLPFVVLGILLYKQKLFFWSYFCLIFPLLLPAEFGFLTSISRGFVQANLFIPFLLIPLFYPKNKKYIPILYVASALSFFLNQSSFLIIVPLFLYVFSFHYRSFKFYLNSFLVLPFFYLDYLAKQFYQIHPERVMHSMTGLELSFDTFKKSINLDHFDYLFPLIQNWGVLYILVFVLLLVYSVLKKEKKIILFLASILLLIFVSFSIPKVQTIYDGAGIFFTRSRLYLTVPILAILSLCIIFKNIKSRMVYVFLLGILSISFFAFKSYKLEKNIKQVVGETRFLVTQPEVLEKRARTTYNLCKRNAIDLVLFAQGKELDYLFDGYSFYPLMVNTDILSVMSSRDRRTWLYEQSVKKENILLVGFSAESLPLKNIENYKVVDENLVIIINKKKNLPELMKKLQLPFGAHP